MSPERLHVHGRCCSRQIQRNLIRGRKRFFPGHVFDIAGERIAQRAVGRSRRLVHAVFLQQIDIQVQQRRTLDDHIIRIISPAVFRMIAVELIQLVILQIKIRNLHLQVRQRRFRRIVALQRNAVIGDGDIDRNRGLIRLIIAILPLVARSRSLDRYRERVRGADGAVAAADGLQLYADSAGFTLRKRQLPASVAVLRDLRLSAVFAHEGILNVAAAAGVKNVRHRHLKHRALRCLHRGGRCCFYAQRVSGSGKRSRRKQAQNHHHGKQQRNGALRCHRRP